MARHPTLTPVALLACAGAAAAQVPTVTNIGVLPNGFLTTGHGLSANGQVVAGNSFNAAAMNRAVRWTSGTGLRDLGVFPGGDSSVAVATSADGSLIVGTAHNAAGMNRAFRWTAPGPIQDLGAPPGASSASDISSDGLVIVGNDALGAFRWTSAEGFINVGSFSPYGTNSDGSVIVGIGNGLQAVKWTAGAGIVNLATLPGTINSSANAVSADGAVITGVDSEPGAQHGVWWNQAGVVHDMGINLTPLAIKDDGSVIVGSVSDGTTVYPFMWTPELGAVDLRTYLTSRGANLTGWLLSQAIGVSDDGTVLMGWGSFNGVTRTWVVNLDPDTDGDGLRDSWEMLGVPYKDFGGVTHRLELPNADPMHKDLYVEVDSMSGFGLGIEAAGMVEEAFANAPVTNPVAPSGIALHIDIDETDLAHVPSWQTGAGDCWPVDFDAYRASFYGTEAERADPNAAALLRAKAKAYRYCIVADQSGPVHWGGCGAQPGDNFVLYVHNLQAAPDRLASAFMHELGHNLGLGHGGGDSVNGKPNYPSIMNYTLSYKYHWARKFWRLDYSRAGSDELLTLNENSLDERFGIGIAGGQYSDYKMPFGINVLVGGVTMRDYDYVWLMNGRVDFGNTFGSGFQDHFYNSGVVQDLNYIKPPPPGIRLPNTPSPGQTLLPFNDWANISLPLSTVSASAPAPAFPSDELTEEAIDWIDQTLRDPVSFCYANCDGSTGAPVLNVNDFICFQIEYATGSPYANCDNSTTPPVLSVNDFICFQNHFAAGCP